MAEIKPVPSRLGTPTRLPDTPMLLYKVPAGKTATVRGVKVTNVTAGATPGVFDEDNGVEVRVWLYAVPPGGSPDATTADGVCGRAIPPTGSLTDDGIMVLLSEEELWGASSPSLGATVRISGAVNSLE